MKFSTFNFSMTFCSFGDVLFPKFSPQRLWTAVCDTPVGSRDSGCSAESDTSVIIPSDSASFSSRTCNSGRGRIINKGAVRYEVSFHTTCPNRRSCSPATPETMMLLPFVSNQLSKAHWKTLSSTSSGRHTSVVEEAVLLTGVVRLVVVVVVLLVVLVVVLVLVLVVAVVVELVEGVKLLNLLSPAVAVLVVL